MNKVKKKINRYIAAALIALNMTGCVPKSNCPYANTLKHIHRYQRVTPDGCTLTAYFLGEDMTCNDFNWQEDFITTTNGIDQIVYKIITNNGLFKGKDNWNYLYKLMCNHPDYLMFYYYYETTQYINHYKTVKDADGNEHEELDYVEIKKIPHDGWTTNPYNSDNTGKVKIVHTRYYGYRIYEDKNKKFILQRSPYVDDIRSIMEDYPYYSANYSSDGIQEFEKQIPRKFSKRELPNLKPSDFNYFTSPDLSNKKSTLSSAIKQRKLYL